MNDVFLGLGISIFLLYYVMLHIDLFDDVRKNHKVKKGKYRKEFYAPMKWWYFIPFVYFIKYM